MRLSHLCRRPLGLVTFLAVALLALPALAEPLAGSGFDLPHDASKHGHQIDWLIYVTLVAKAILFAIMVGWMLIAAFKHNKKHRADVVHGTTKKAAVLPLAIAGIVFFIVDGNLFVNSTIQVEGLFWNFPKVEKMPDVVRIEINAHQWAWDARYAGPDGKFNTRDDIVTLNDIRVPVDTPVYLQMASTDVIHSFYLPHFRTKRDVVPGSVTQLWFHPVETGEFEIGCAQHCGVHHYKMRGLLTVMPKDEFEAWAARASALSAQAYDESNSERNWGWEWKK